MADIASSPVLVPHIITAGEDLWQGLWRPDLWGRLGWLEVKRRYRRTTIGPFWSTLSLAISVGAIGAVGSGLWGQSVGNYLPFLSAGMVIWVMVSAILTEAGTLLISSVSIFRQLQFDYSLLVYAAVWRNFVVFLHNLLVYFIIMLVLAPQFIQPVILLVVPGLALVLINGAWITLLLGLFCLRFRDMQQFITSIVSISLFVTPIFWPPENLHGVLRLVFVHLNPLFHLIDVARGPLIGQVPRLESYVAVVLMAVFGWGVTYLAFRRFRRRIAYWS